MISKQKKEKLKQRMAVLGILELDIHEKQISGHGKGGQKQNKSQSSIYLVHEPSQIAIKCQESRSQEHNRYYARQRLCDQLEQLQLGKKSRLSQAIEKKRKQKARRKRRSSSKEQNPLL